MNKPTQYQRVIPRDLFNEAKLLKCMGQLCLLIHDNLTPAEMNFSHDNSPFQIGLLIDGTLTIKNLTITINGKPFLFKTKYNSRANYPLYLEYDSCDYQVFNDKGEFDQEFIDFCETVK